MREEYVVEYVPAWLSDRASTRYCSLVTNGRPLDRLHAVHVTGEVEAASNHAVSWAAVRIENACGVPKSAGSA
ncbi:MAG: hypothetical protein M0D55_01640 [Elusimicrobiota bacterium]|nr:MAG: hypothetical protein M0D55_01640 [Elusimicrobiota bacterium]